jgi:septum formation protein
VTSIAAALALGPIALASRSPQRRMILEQAGIPFTVVESSYDEQPQPGLSAQALVAFHARGKADGAPQQEAAAVLGVDTVVEVDGDILGKPRDRGEAGAFLRRLSGAEHRVHSGLHLRSGGNGIEAVETTTVRFAALEEPDLAWYLDTGEWMHRAGGYAIQGRGAALVTGIDGDYLNVVGLPLRALLDAMVAARV